MTKLTNYYFVNASNKAEVVIPEILGGDFKGDFSLIGFDEEGSMVMSENVTNISDLVVTTNDDTQYKVEGMCSDYADFIDAIALNIPVIEKWELDNIPLRTVICGISNGEPFSKKMVSQDGNFFDLEDGSKCFINWSSMSDTTKKRMEISYYHSYFSNIDNFCGFKCRVIL